MIVDWLPWSHTFGANHNFNLVLAHGGTLYIDGGKPAPGAFDETLATCARSRRRSTSTCRAASTCSSAHLETDAALRATFFRELDVVFYAAAALSPATWERLEAVAATRGRADRDDVGVGLDRDLAARHAGPLSRSIAPA